MSDGRSGSAGIVPYLVFSWEHDAFWRPNRCGYTRFIERAGRYSKEEAEAICKAASYGDGRRSPYPTDSTDGETLDAPPNEICFPAPEAIEIVAREAILMTAAAVK